MSEVPRPVEESAAAPAAKLIHWNIVSEPAGASVLSVGGKLLGKTPYKDTRAVATGTMILLLRHDGYEDLRLKLLEQLLRNEINERQKKNLAKAKSFRDLLEATIQRYHNRLIDAAAVIQKIIDMRKAMETDDRRRAETGLTDDELAFFDAVAQNYATLYEEPFLRALVHEVVQAIKRNLKVDWTEPHRDDVKAAITTAVKRVLRREGVREEDFDPFITRFMEQAQALYADWPLAA